MAIKTRELRTKSRLNMIKNRPKDRLAKSKRRVKNKFWFRNWSWKVRFGLAKREGKRYKKATKGWRLTYHDMLFDGKNVTIVVVSDWHEVHGWLSERPIKVSFDDILAGKFIENCKEKWKNERDDLSKFTRNNS